MLRAFELGDLDWLVDQHQQHYTQVEKFDHSFAPLVRQVAGSFLRGHDPGTEAGWIAQDKGARVGSLFCMRDDAEMARLRLFYIAASARGTGQGRRMLAHAMGFARNAGYLGICVATYDTHVAACGLYRATGWQQVDSKPVFAFGRQLTEIHFTYRF